MTITEQILRIAYQLEPMAPVLVSAVLVTAAAVGILLLLCRKAWIDKKRFAVLGVFFGLGFREKLALACGWLKFVLVVIFVVRFRTMEKVEYMMVLLPGILGAFSVGNLKKWAENLMWLALQLLGLTSAGMVCRFIRESPESDLVQLVYMAMGLFLIFFSLYLFLGELGTISTQRHIDPKKIWKREKTEET